MNTSPAHSAQFAETCGPAGGVPLLLFIVLLAYLVLSMTIGVTRTFWSFVWLVLCADVLVILCLLIRSAAYA